MPYVFGDCTLDPQRYELRRQGTCIPLRPKVFQVLTYLIEQRHRVVTRDELLAQVWANQCVGDETLTSCVKAARRAVGDSGQAQRVIQTVYGRGLRFVAEVTVADALPAAPAVAAPPMPAAGARPPQQPLVGREAELTVLHQWYATARQGQRQVGFITGEAGIGKTALVEAFMAQVATEAEVWIGHGQCIAQYGTGEAYFPVLEALGRLCRGPGGAHLLAWLRQQAPSWLGQMPALLQEADRDALQRLARDATQARMLRELAEALESLTAERPLILVLEDLHWSDGATHDWLAYVARRRDPARLLVLATYRPAEARVAAQPMYPLTRELLVHGRGSEVVLGALSVAEVAAYVTRRFGEGPLASELTPVLHQRTQGNPLFLATVLADLVQRGILWQGPAGWALTAPLDIATVGVPETLRQLIEQQFERLAPAEQALVEAASVAGVDFSAAAVAAGIGLRVDDVDARCAALARQGLVQAHGTATWPDGTVAGQYCFGHALYQEVVYARVPVGSRTRMHQQIGRRLETAYGEQAREIAAELAVHFDRGRDSFRAAQYRRQAAQNALRRHGHRDAIAHCTAGLEVLATLPGTPERTRRELALHTILGPALITARGYAASEVEQTYTRALELCDALGDPPERFAVLLGLTAWHFVRGECTTALEPVEQLLQLARRRNDPALLVEAHTAMGTLLMFRGELTASWAHLEAGLALYDPDQHRAHVYTYGQDPGLLCLSQGVDNLWLRGYPDQALERLHAALELARGLSHPSSLAYTMLIAALLHQRRGDVDAVRKWADAATTLATEHAFPHWLALGTMYTGWVLAAQGRVAEGLAQTQQGLTEYRAAGVGVGATRWLGLLAELYGRNSRAAAGRSLLPEAFAAMRSGLWNHVAELYQIQGDLLGQEGRYAEEAAEASLHQALAVARQQQARSLELRAAVSLGRLWQRQGKRDAARELVATVYGWFSEGFDTADLQTARALLEELR
jgi:DNA-binding winged helix-turn-helix (wHTH) protein/predicted ATPase